MSNTKQCTMCGGSLVRDERERTCRYTKKTLKKAQTFSVTYRQPGWWCNVCGEGFIKDDDHRVHDEVFTELRARVEGVLSPKQIRAIRNKLGLSKRKASFLVGGGYNAFQRYESGEIVPSGSASCLISLLGERPELQHVIPFIQESSARHTMALSNQEMVEIQMVSG